MAYLERERLAREERQDARRCLVATACPACGATVRVTTGGAWGATVLVECLRCKARFKVTIHGAA